MTYGPGINMFRKGKSDVLARMCSLRRARPLALAAWLALGLSLAAGAAGAVDLKDRLWDLQLVPLDPTPAAPS